MATTLGLAFLAGIVSILSPCVLPLVPLVLGAAASRHRFGPLALAGGLALSFTAMGLFLATLGYELNIDGSVFRVAGAVVMMLVGAVMLVPALQVRFATTAGPIGGWADARFGGGPGAGLSGQFGIGLLLGVVWSPCVGPTLGAASLLASQGRDLAAVTGAMVFFGAGAALPLLALGLLSRDAFGRLRGRLLETGRFARMALGMMLVMLGVLIVSGLDRSIEAKLVDASPTWMTTLSTRF